MSTRCSTPALADCLLCFIEDVGVRAAGVCVPTNLQWKIFICQVHAGSTTSPLALQRIGPCVRLQPHMVPQEKKDSETFGLLGCRVKRGFTRQPENSKHAHFKAPALQTPPKFNERTPKETEERKIIVAGEGNKSAKFWDSHPSGLHFCIRPKRPKSVWTKSGLGQKWSGPKVVRFGAGQKWSPFGAIWVVQNRAQSGLGKKWSGQKW